MKASIPATALLLLALAACAPAPNPPTLPATAAPVIAATSTAVPLPPPLAPTVVPPARLGTVPLAEVNHSGISGTFAAGANRDSTVTLRIELQHAAAIHPWGIYTLADCAQPVAENQKPVFFLPDIEGGHLEETVETQPYLATPGNLVVVVFSAPSANGPTVVACAGLGPPAAPVAATQPTAPAACAPRGVTLPAAPPGGRIAFSGSRANNSDIYLLNADGSGLTRLTTDPALDLDPSWSPDGTHIAFRTSRDGNDEIYIMNADGTCQTNLTRRAVDDRSPAWSPDGQRIAFATFFDRNTFTDLAVISVDGTGLTRLTTHGGEYPSWSPDGTRIAFATARDGNYEIYVMNADGSGQRNLSSNPVYDMSPAWSPDGARIAFDSERAPDQDGQVGSGPEFEIMLMQADGSAQTRLTTNAVEDRFPAWSPDGAMLLFARSGSLYRMRPDGTQQASLPNPLGNGILPDWQPAR